MKRIVLILLTVTLLIVNGFMGLLGLLAYLKPENEMDQGLGKWIIALCLVGYLMVAEMATRKKST